MRRLHVLIRRRSAGFPDTRAVLRLLVDSPVAHRPGGQPFLPRHPELGVSLSDDGDWLAVAVADGCAVGIDVQCPLPASAIRLRGCAALAALPDVARDLEYARIWTVQEACVKAAGTGLAGRPWRIPVGAGQLHGRWEHYDWCTVSATPVPVSIAVSRLRSVLPLELTGNTSTRCTASGTR